METLERIWELIGGFFTGLGSVFEHAITSLFGSSNPSTDILKMLDLYNQGKLKLDELVTKHYKIDEVAQGYEDMHAGKNIRGVIIY